MVIPDNFPLSRNASIRGINIAPKNDTSLDVYVSLNNECESFGKGQYDTNFTLSA